MDKNVRFDDPLELLAVHVLSANYQLPIQTKGSRLGMVYEVYNEPVGCRRKHQICGRLSFYDDNRVRPLTVLLLIDIIIDVH